MTLYKQVAVFVGLTFANSLLIMNISCSNGDLIGSSINSRLQNTASVVNGTVTLLYRGQSNKGIIWTYWKKKITSDESIIYTNEKLLPSLMDRYRVTNNADNTSSLVIQRVQSSDAGVYSCETASQSQRSFAWLTVLESAPVCHLRQDFQDDLVEIKCSVNYYGPWSPSIDFFVVSNGTTNKINVMNDVMIITTNVSVAYSVNITGLRNGNTVEVRTFFDVNVSPPFLNSQAINTPDSSLNWTSPVILRQYNPGDFSTTGQQPSTAFNNTESRVSLTALPSHLRVLEGDEASFVCTSTNHPPAQLIFKWTRGANDLLPRHAVDIGGRLTISRAHADDSGDYTCQAVGIDTGILRVSVKLSVDAIYVLAAQSTVHQAATDKLVSPSEVIAKYYSTLVIGLICALIGVVIIFVNIIIGIRCCRKRANANNIHRNGTNTNTMEPPQLESTSERPYEEVQKLSRQERALDNNPYDNLYQDPDADRGSIKSAVSYSCIDTTPFRVAMPPCSPRSIMPVPAPPVPTSEVRTVTKSSTAGLNSQYDFPSNNSLDKRDNKAMIDTGAYLTMPSHNFIAPPLSGASRETVDDQPQIRLSRTEVPPADNQYQLQADGDDNGYEVPVGNIGTL